MEIQLIRHATLKIRYGGAVILVDPMFAEKGTMDPVANSANEFRNPLVSLQQPISEVLQGIEAVIVTHMHRDHFDDAAIRSLPKGIPLFCQPEDAERIRGLGFQSVIPVETEHEWNGIMVSRTGGRHGTGEVGEAMGPVSGFVLRSAGEPAAYIAGDTIWCTEVEAALASHQPEVVVLNGGEARFNTGGPITMGAADIEQVSRHAKDAAILVVHMESWNHCLLGRKELKASFQEADVTGVFIMDDGESLVFG